jgi:hypothetical protein
VGPTPVFVRVCRPGTKGRRKAAIGAPSAWVHHILDKINGSLARRRRTTEEECAGPLAPASGRSLGAIKMYP